MKKIINPCKCIGYTYYGKETLVNASVKVLLKKAKKGHKKEKI